MSKTCVNCRYYQLLNLYCEHKEIRASRQYTDSCHRFEEAKQEKKDTCCGGSGSCSGSCGNSCKCDGHKDNRNGSLCQKDPDNKKPCDFCGSCLEDLSFTRCYTTSSCSSESEPLTLETLQEAYDLIMSQAVQPTNLEWEYGQFALNKYADFARREDWSYNPLNHTLYFSIEATIPLQPYEVTLTFDTSLDKEKDKEENEGRELSESDEDTWV